MRILSFFNLYVDKAMAIEAARGAPSGIETIKMETPIIIILA